MKLSDTSLRRGTLPDGLHSDGHNLYLRVAGRSRAWVFIFRSPATGKRREMGLGRYPDTSLALARQKAREAHELLARGLDPLAKKRRQAAPTLETAMLEFIAVRGLGSRYRGYLKHHLGELRDIRIDQVTTSAIKTSLLPIWGRPLGRYVQSALERMLDYATVAELRTGANPARWKGHLELLMPTIGHRVTHHRALRWQDAPAVYAQIAASNSIATRCMQVTILLGLRQKEARELRWREVSADRIVIPAARYKTDRDHILPIGPVVKALLGERGEPDAFVFPGAAAHKPLSHMAFDGLLATLGLERLTSNHGWRTTLAVWAVEHGGFPDELAQRVLGHVVGTAVTRAYQRSDFFDQKRELLDAWASYLTGT